MSSRSRFLSLKRFDNQEGFTIIEVLVSFTLLAIVTIGTVPLFVSGLRGSLVSKMETGGKNLSQQRIEQMRNLQFHVDVTSPSPADTCTTPSYTKLDAEAAACDYRDMLDTYYRTAGKTSGTNTFAATTLSSGYVAGTTICSAAGDNCSGNGRTKDEPSTGPFYRFAYDPVPGFPRYRQYIATQFIDTNRLPVTPPTTYNSQLSGSDSPPSRLVGVTLITVWQVGGLTKKFVTFTQIADARPLPSSVVLSAGAIALSVATATSDGQNLTLEAGESNSDGGLSAGGFAATKALSGSAQLGEVLVEGKSKKATAPPNQSSTTEGDASTNTLSHADGSVLVNFINTQVKNVGASVSLEQPIVATPTAMSAGRIRVSGSTGNENLIFSNLRSGEATPMLFFNPLEEMIRILETGSGIGTAEGGTYLRSVAGGSHYAESGARIEMQPMYLFPAPLIGANNGVIRVRVNSAALRCLADGTGASAVTYGSSVGTSPDIVVEYWNQTAYTTVDINSLPAPATTSVFGAVTLADFITSWTGTTTPQATINGSKVTASIDFLSILTNQTRSDANSRLDIKIGSLNCQAEDAR